MKQLKTPTVMMAVEGVLVAGATLAAYLSHAPAYQPIILALLAGFCLGSAITMELADRLFEKYHEVLNEQNKYIEKVSKFLRQYRNEYQN